MVVATPSGITLAPEGGAHQSINTPLIGLSQPGLLSFEPAFADELRCVLRDILIGISLACYKHAATADPPAREIMQWGFNHMQAKDGSSIYLRLSTRALTQPVREMDHAMREDILKGAYWHHPPTDETKAVITFCGVVAPEAMQAYDELSADGPLRGKVALLQVCGVVYVGVVLRGVSESEPCMCCRVRCQWSARQ